MVKSHGVYLILTLMLVVASYGQQAGDVWSAKGGYTWLFNPKTMETLSGEVVAVGKFTAGGKPSGVRFTLKTEQGPIEVILGRGSYVEQQDLQFEPKDKVTVKGSRVAVEERMEWSPKLQLRGKFSGFYLPVA